MCDLSIGLHIQFTLPLGEWKGFGPGLLIELFGSVDNWTKLQLLKSSPINLPWLGCMICLPTKRSEDVDRENNYTSLIVLSH